MTALSWEPISGGCKNAVDLVRLIRKEHGDYFCIGIAGFPGKCSTISNISDFSWYIVGLHTLCLQFIIIFKEGHPYSTPFPTPRFPQPDDSIVDTTAVSNTTDNEAQSELLYLKEKVDAGADFILTQFFYDPAVFISFKNRCTSLGIRVPIIPGKHCNHIECFSKLSLALTRNDAYSKFLVVSEDDEILQNESSFKSLDRFGCHQRRWWRS